MNIHLDRQNKLEAQLLTITQELSTIGTLDAATGDLAFDERIADARPIPEPAPVMIATFPSNAPIMRLL